MSTRRGFLTGSLLTAVARSGDAPTPLSWSHLPGPARAIAPDLGLTRDTWPQWQAAQRAKLEQRIHEGTAEHVTYFMLQSRSFCEAAPLEPMRLAHESPNAMPAAAAHRAQAFTAATPRDERHRLIAAIHDTAAWPTERCYHHTMAFLRAKEVERKPLEELYYHRGLSSDTAPTSAQTLDKLPGTPERILLAGPGLDLTRREKFHDNLPLTSHQLTHLRARYPHAAIETVDVRPEVLRALDARRVDLTTEVPPGTFDLIVATNILLYFENRELLTAMAGLTQALCPGGRLVHNDQRFAAKVFGEALGLTMERFEPLQFAARKGIEQWDRVVVHRKP